MLRWKRFSLVTHSTIQFLFHSPPNLKPTTIIVSTIPNRLPPSSFSSHSRPTPPTIPPLPISQSFTDGDEQTDSDADADVKPDDSGMLRDLETIIGCLRDFRTDACGAKRRLELCSVAPTPDLAGAALSRLRHDWAAAYTFFLWAGPAARTPRCYHSVLAALARARRFDTAWSLVAEMRTAALLTPHTLLLLARRYAAAHDVAGAINTFYAHKRFGFTPGIAEFQGLLAALCRYKNVEDAEHLLICNEKAFAFETKSFNIVLNGWCNVLVRVGHGKRFWAEMDRRGIAKDAVSYGCMMSLYSKAGSLNDVLKLFDRMKVAGIAPDRKAYNAVVYALAKGKCVEEAKRLVRTMEEKDVAPDAVTFNSLIGPLCKARKIEDARALFDDMLDRGLSPSVRTYHAFFDVLRSTDEVFELLNRMKEKGCRPVGDTYVMLIRKLCRWKQHESVFRLWDEMCTDGLGPDRSAYIVLIHGLFLNGRLEEASKYYEEMKGKDFEPEPKTDEMIQAWLSGRVNSESSGLTELEAGNRVATETLYKKPKGTSYTLNRNRDFQKWPETRSVTREHGTLSGS